MKLAAICLSLAIPLTAGCSESPEAPAPEETVADTGEEAWLPADFTAPTLAEAEGFKLVPLGPDLVEVDYEAYMSSIPHLQETFTRSTGWPREDLTLEDSMRDMESEASRFAARESFAYGVLTPDGSRELGSVYVSPSPVEGYDARVRMWVTKDQYDAGFDAELYDWVRQWIEREWPFSNVAYPGRAIDWESWDEAVAASEAAADQPQP